MKYHLIIVLISIGILGQNFKGNQPIDQYSTVGEVLHALGDSSLLSHYPNNEVNGFSSLIGEDIVKNGFSNRKKLKSSKRQSKYFVCTSCHNIEREDPDLTKSDPQDRLIYTQEKGLPFLQATTLYGAINRTHFYNGDYYKKYGDLVTNARNDIRAAIQLCATECAQGRRLKDFELESVVAYLWDLGLTMNDINLSSEEENMVNAALQGESDTGPVVEIIKSKYLQGSPATFLEKPDDISKGYNHEGDPQNGQLIYEGSCLHCHYKKKYSFFNLDNSKMTFRFLRGKADNYSRYSLYQVIRYGTYPKHGKKSYMPLYPKEKMNNQQVEDLRAYFNVKAS